DLVSAHGAMHGVADGQVAPVAGGGHPAVRPVVLPLDDAETGRVLEPCGGGQVARVAGGGHPALRPVVLPLDDAETARILDTFGGAVTAPGFEHDHSASIGDRRRYASRARSARLAAP